MKEHAVVIFIRPFKHEDRVIPVGAKGTIVHIHPGGKAVEVELPECEVVTVDNPEHYLVDSGWRAGEVAAMEALVEELKSGHITLDDIREATEKLKAREEPK